MTELDDHELLAEFARSESEEAFDTLVARHVNLVYSAALRFTANPHHAQEITQAVFIILARKAKSLSRKTILSGWLYQTARLTAANFVRGEIRRQQREQEAYMQSTLNESRPAAWEQIAPLLDEAMGGLGETDRNAIVLRFFENRTAQEVGAAMKLTEAAAHKRTARALEKLRKFFSKRGVTLSATLIAGVVSANSVHAAPIALAATVTMTAVKGSAATVSTLTLVKGVLKLMAWTKVKTAIGIGACVLMGGGALTAIVEANKSSPIDAYIQDSDLNDFQKAPEMVAIQETHFAHTNFATGGRRFSDKAAGRNIPLSFAIADAYGFHPTHIIFPSDMPATQVDYLVTSSNRPWERFRAEIERTFGFVGRIELIRTNVLLLELADSHTNKLKVSPWPEAITQTSHDPSRFVEWPNSPLSTLVGFLQNETAMPVFDRTGLTNFFDIVFEWQWRPHPQISSDTESRLALLKRVLRDQLGLALVSTNEPIGMLVVERANN